MAKKKLKKSCCKKFKKKGMPCSGCPVFCGVCRDSLKCMKKKEVKALGKQLKEESKRLRQAA